MSTRTQRNRREKKAKYLLFAILGLMSLFAYTTHYKSQQEISSDRISESVKPKFKAFKQHEIISPFAERWEKMYADADIESYLLDDDFKKTRHFFDGYNVASNEDFVLPTEETGAGNPKENHIQNLNDVVVADMVPTGYSTGGSAAGGGGVGGVGGGGAGGGRDNNRTQYVAKEDVEEGGNGDNTGNNPSNGDANGGGSSNGGVSAVPLPSAIWLLGSAFIGFIGLRRKQSVL